MTAPRRYGPREDEPCGSWVPIRRDQTIPSFGPRRTCARRYHPDDPFHCTADRKWWWRSTELVAHDTDTDPPHAEFLRTANAQDRDNRNATPVLVDQLQAVYAEAHYNHELNGPDLAHRAGLRAVANYLIDRRR